VVTQHALVTSAQGYGAYSQVYFVNKNSSISVYTTLEEPEKAESEDPQNYANTYIRLKGSTSNIKVASKDLAALAWQKKNGDQSTTRVCPRSHNPFHYKYGKALTKFITDKDLLR